MPIPKQPSLRDYWSILSKRKTVIIITFVIVVLIAIYLTKEKKQEAIYNATAKIVIEGALVQLEPYFQRGEVIRRDYRASIDFIFLQTQHEIIKSRLVLEKAMEMLGYEGTGEETSIEDLKNMLVVSSSAESPGGGQNMPPEKGAILSVSVRNKNPRVAMEAANAIAQAYIELKEEERQNIISTLYSSLEKQVREAKAKLDAAEKTLEEYKNKEGLIILEGRDLSSQTIEQVNNQLLGVRSELAKKETLLKTLKELLAKDSLSALTLAAENLGSMVVINVGIKQEMLKAQHMLNSLLQIYKDKHPEVIRMKSQLKLYEQQLQGEVQGAIDSLQADIESKHKLEKMLAEFLQRPDLGEKQKKLQDLQRDVEFNRRFYENLFLRLKEVDITEQIEVLAEFKILDPAILPTEPLPTEKRRARLISPIIALIFAIILAFVFEYLDNTIKTIEDVETYLDIPVLGVIPHVSVAKKVKKK